MMQNQMATGQLKSGTARVVTTPPSNNASSSTIFRRQLTMNASLPARAALRSASLSVDFTASVPIPIIPLIFL
jgi:hypothetical protein